MTTKLLLLAIALGLWANALIPLLKPPVTRADSLDSHLENIEHDLHGLYGGACPNNKIC